VVLSCLRNNRDDAEFERRSNAIEYLLLLLLLLLSTVGGDSSKREREKEMN